MKIQEILLESYMDPDIKKILVDKGYKYLSSGVDQAAYLAPDGMILKIFGSSRQSGGGVSQLTKSQKIFKAYADYCLAHPTNPFLPNFTDWATFQFNGRTYLQIKMERLFPFTGAAAGWNEVLSVIADRAERFATPDDRKKFLSDLMARAYTSKETEQLVMHLGEDGLNMLWDTIYDLMKLGKKLGLRYLDLHSGNFMLGSDGHIVISDPFYAGDGS